MTRGRERGMYIAQNNRVRRIIRFYIFGGNLFFHNTNCGKARQNVLGWWMCMKRSSGCGEVEPLRRKAEIFVLNKRRHRLKQVEKHCARELTTALRARRHDSRFPEEATRAQKVDVPCPCHAAQKLQGQKLNPNETCPCSSRHYEQRGVGAPEDTSGAPGENGKSWPKSAGQQVTLRLQGTEAGGPPQDCAPGEKTLEEERSQCHPEARGISPGNMGKPSFIWMSLMWDTVSPTWAELSEVQDVLGVKNFIELRWEGRALYQFQSALQEFQIICFVLWLLLLF